MSERSVAAAIAERLGTDALARLRRLRRRLWWRRAVRSGLLVIAAAVLAVAAVQLLARAFPLEIAPLDPGRHRRPGARRLAGRTPGAAVRRSSRPRAARTRSSACASASARRSSSRRHEIGRSARGPPARRCQRARLNEVDLRRAFRPRLAQRPLIVAGAGHRHDAPARRVAEPAGRPPPAAARGARSGRAGGRAGRGRRGRGRRGERR